MITIYFESHATTEDNEAKLAAGWFDALLSPLGKEQAKDLGVRYKDKHIDAIFCSDLRRSYETAQIAFGETYPIMQDRRLRECNYGDMSRDLKNYVDAYKEQALTKPYPNGESFLDTSARMKSFLEDLLKDYDGKTVMIIGHRATQYGLDEWVKGLSLRDAVLGPWQWQPGWTYELSALPK
jgi:broad specificity phosphatase PhoE